MQKEQLSALMDGELFDSELISSLTSQQALQQTWRSYHLIRDTLRGDLTSVVQVDITDQVMLALDDEPTRLLPESVMESQPAPHSWKRLPFWNKVRPWASQFSQIGVAACVSMAVIFGVQHYNQSNGGVNNPESPVFNTLPLGGQASPVSFGVQSNSDTSAQQQLQQRNRINAVLQDYELQRRLHSEQLQAETASSPLAAQAQETQISGAQQ